MCLIELIKSIKAEKIPLRLSSTPARRVHENETSRELCRKYLIKKGFLLKAVNSPATCSVAFLLRTTPNSFFASHQYTPPSFFTALLGWKKLKWEKRGKKCYKKVL